MLRALFTCQGLCILALSLSACGDDGTTAELYNGSFAYSCTSDRDPMCGQGETFMEGALTTMPNSVAVGASFSVVFNPSSSAAQEGSALVTPVSQELLQKTGGTEAVFKAMRPGFAGLLAMRGSTVVDFIHVQLAKMDHIRIDAGPDPASAVPVDSSSVKIKLDTFYQLRATAVDEDGEDLAGSLSVEWTSDDSAIAEITSSPMTDEITVKGIAFGETKLRVSVEGVITEVPINIVSSAAKYRGGPGAADRAEGAP